MSTPAISGLAGLVQGFTQEQHRIAKEELDKRAGQRDMMVQYLGQLAANQNIPVEHQQWALGKVQELLQADPSKKLPKIDLGELPPVSIQQPSHQAAPSLPQMTLQAPVAPGGGTGPSGPSASAPAPSGDVGRASDKTVNALGASSGVSAPGAEPAVPSLQAPLAPFTLPAQRQSIVQNPVAPKVISPGGLHLLTPSDRNDYAQAAQGDALNKLQQQYPDKDVEELAYFAKHGEFPKDEAYSLEPGQARYKNGKEVARNTEKKPGQKSGYSTKPGPSGEPMIVDNETGAELTPQEVQSIPEAKKLLDSATQAHSQKLKEQEDKENRQAQKQAEQQARAFAQQEKITREREEALSATTKSMVEAAPKVLALSARLRAQIAQQQAELGPAASRWNEFMAGKVGAPNPEFTRLRTDTGLLQTLLMRMHVGARGGEHMMAHFSEMINSSKQSPENMLAALDEIDRYASDVAATPKSGAGQIAAHEGAAKSGGGETLPPQAVARLQEGHETTFANGQTWTLRNGQPVKVR